MRQLPYQFASNPANERPTWGNLMTFLSGAVLLLSGTGMMAAAGGPMDPDGAMDFLIGAGLSGAGFILSWSRSRNRAGWLIVVGLAARAILLPLEPGVEYRARMERGAQAASGSYSYLNPAKSRAVLAEESKAGIEKADTERAMMPMTLAVFKFLSRAGESEWIGKAALASLDLLLGMLLVWKLGAERGCLYLWNPLAIYSVAGLGHPAPLFLLPMACGLLVWKGAIDDKDGSPFVSSSGNYGGVLEKTVWLASLLVGLACSFNAFFIPILAWLILRVLTQAGLLAGLAALVCGSIPMTVSFLWGYLEWAQPPFKALLDPLRLGEGPASFFPELVGRVAPGGLTSGMGFIVVIAVVAVVLMLKPRKLERFGCAYFAFVMVLVPQTMPWHFLWMAPFALAARHAGFRLASVCALAGLLVRWPGSSEQGWIWAVYWIPFALGSIWYWIRYSLRDDGMYVRKL